METQALKIVVLGHESSLKSLLTLGLLDSEKERSTCTENDFFNKQLSFRGIHYQIEVLDTTGTEQFAAMKDAYIRQGDSFLLTFNVHSLTSFLQLASEVNLLMRVKNATKIPIVVVGTVLTSSTEPRTVSSERAKEFARFLDATYLECPLDNGEGPTRVLSQLVARVEELSRDTEVSKARPASPKTNLKTKSSTLLKRLCHPKWLVA